MTKIKLCASTLLLLIAITIRAIPGCFSTVLDKRLCYDPKCSVPISMAKTKLTYNSVDPHIMSFPAHTDVTIYSKSAGKKGDLWGVEINGKRGYVPKTLVQEYKIFNGKLKYEVPAEELADGLNKSNVKTVNHVKKGKPVVEKEETVEDLIEARHGSELVDSDISEFIPTENIDKSIEKSEEPEKKKEEKQSSIAEATVRPYEVIDGTTIGLNNERVPINPSSVQITSINDTDQRDLFDTSKTQLPFVGDVRSDNMEATNASIEKLKTETVKIQSSVEDSVDEIKEHREEREEATASIIEQDEEQQKMKIDNKKENNSIANVDLSSIYSKDQVVPQMEQGSKKEPNMITASNVNDASIKNIINVEPIRQDEVGISAEKIKEDKDVKHLQIEQDSKEGQSMEIAVSMDEANIQDAKIESTDIPGVDENVVTISKNLVGKYVKKSNEKMLKKETERISEKVLYEESPENIMPENVPKVNSFTKVPFFAISEKEDTVHTSTSETKLVRDDIESQEPKIAGKDSSRTTIENIMEITKTVAEEQNETMESEKVIDNMQNTSIVATEIPNVEDQTVNNDNLILNVSISSSTVMYEDRVFDSYKQGESLQSNHQNVITETGFDELRGSRNLLNTEDIHDVEDTHDSSVKLGKDESTQNQNENIETSPKYDNSINDEDNTRTENPAAPLGESRPWYTFGKTKETIDSITANEEECTSKDREGKQDYFTGSQGEIQNTKRDSLFSGITYSWESILYVSMTAFTTLIFSLGYYYIENVKRDKQLIVKINKLEKELLVSTKECATLDENLKATKSKLASIEDESFGSNEMVLLLKADLEASQNAKLELEDQIAALEKDLESVTEAGLELERMLREVLSSNNEVNPLAQSVEDLQARLNTQQTANESLRKALDLKTHEIEALRDDLTSTKKRCEELDLQLMEAVEKLNTQTNLKNSIEETLTDRVQQLETQLKNISTEKSNLYKELKNKEAEIADLTEVVEQISSNNLDLEKLYEVSHIKAEATQLLQERDDLKVRLAEVEGAHILLEEHMKLIKEEMSSLSEQFKVAEKEKKDAETRLEVLSNFFREKEAERQKEEAIWLEKQGEVASTVERIQTMQNELQSYRQQVEMLKREILDQEREYKLQISALETKAHEQWVITRQNERRLEESKAEAAQLRNRLTLIEKNINDADSDGKLHRLEANGETTTPPQLFLRAESSSSPIMFSGTSGVPPAPPPSYLPFPPYLPLPLPSTSGIPPYDVGQRPPPLGGRLSSPPPMPMHPPAPGNRYEGTGSPPPVSSPRIPPPFDRHRSPPPPPLGSDRIHPPPPPLPGLIFSPTSGTTHSWGEETLPPLRNTAFHPHQREQRTRNYKGSLHSSGESLDKTHLSGKI